MCEIKQLGGTKIKSRIKAVSIPRIQGLGTQSLSTERSLGRLKLEPS